MKSREQLEIEMPGSSSWMPCAPQGVKGFDDDDYDNDDDDDKFCLNILRTICERIKLS